MNHLLHDPALVQLPHQLEAEAALTRRGILTEPVSSREYFSGYSYQTLYDWDQYFEALVQVYMGWDSSYIRNGVTIFLDHQRPDGHIARSVPSNEYHDPEHVKPFLAQIAWTVLLNRLVYRAYGEIEWITSERYFYRLQSYLDYWLGAMDANHNGLSEWMSAPHTGMDNQHERAGWWLDRFSEDVDLNCYLVREFQAFAQIAALMGKTELSAHYTAQSSHLAERIRALCWNEADGSFYDHNARSGEPLMSRHAGWASTLNGHPIEQIRVKGISAFMVLWVGVATPHQAQRLVYEHLFNPLEFWSPHPIPALTRSERWYTRDHLPADLGCNWRAKTWIPTNYMVYHGLRRYGYTQLASLLADATHRTVLPNRLVQRTGNREYYDAETGTGEGLDPFWGWSLLGHFMPYEESTPKTLTALEE